MPSLVTAGLAWNASLRNSTQDFEHRVLASNPNHNHLLAALPAAEFQRLASCLELVPMPLGETLYEPGGELQHAYFPTTAIVSLLYITESGASAEMAAVGKGSPHYCCQEWR